MWRLHKRLEQKGFACFNGKQVPAGEDWRVWWAGKTLTCVVVVPILSPPFFDSEACCDELTFAKNKSRIIIPVGAEPYGTCPPAMDMILMRTNRIPPAGPFDVTEEDFERNFEQLCGLLAAHKVANAKKTASTQLVHTASGHAPTSTS